MGHSTCKLSCDLLLAGGTERNAAQMATLCHLHASDQESHNEHKMLLIAKAKQAGRRVHGFELESMRTILHTSLAPGDQYFQSIRNDEIAWIEAGDDASLEFRKKYLQAAR